MGEDLKQLKERLPLLEYLQRHNWNGRRAGLQQEFVGLCPLHQETRPSFYVNTGKNLFYCHGCGRGGDLIRFVELFRHLSFRQSVAYLEQELASEMRARSVSELLGQVAGFYHLELRRHPEAVQYLGRRGVQDSSLIEELGLGYAPGGNLGRRMAALGYSLDLLLATGLINQQGRDAFCRRVIFPCRQCGQVVNFYGRSVGAAFPHRLLPRSKGGLFAWGSVRYFSNIILVEGLFDLAVLWQAGFRNTTCAIGTHLTSVQISQLSDSPGRRVYIAFDHDENQAGQQAAHQLARRLECAGLEVRIVQLPYGLESQQLFRLGRHGRRLRCLSGTSTTAMKLTLVHQPAVPASVSPYRLLTDEQRQEIVWTNAFLDAQRIRQLSLRSLRAYAYDLLHFARWWLQQRPLPLSQITESTLLDYVRHQLDQQPKPTPQTVNHRLCVVRCLYRFHYGREIPTGESHFQHLYTKPFSLRYGRPMRVIALGIRLKQPRRIIVPLSSEQVAQFWDRDIDNIDNESRRRDV